MDISGQAIFADIGKMPHLLVAGATGSGKSVCINTLISSILFKAAPDEVKFILIDPKMVELSNYNGIPHLMVPVVTDPKKASSVLNWAVQEMEKRYAVFASHSVRDIKSFNRRYAEEKMPFIVIVIDELADLMMVSPRDVEDSICRILQKARAAGIHMILATQRPSVNVITGIIKANLPSRISFAVSSQVDSRTILDRGGAETLLGKGDMLFSPQGAPKPIRVQGAFISDEEVEMLLDYIRSQGQEVSENEELIDFIENDSREDDSSEEDEFLVKQDKLLPDAVELVMSTGQASSSSIQRRFRVGYSRAARLVDTMEELRIIGPSGGGNKPREILMSQEQAMELVKSLM
jgi:DNA translocase ftsK